MNDSGPRLQARSKIRLEIDGEPVFGQGREELLRLIQKETLINAAAKAMGIPYRKAWTYIDAMEILQRRARRRVSPVPVFPLPAVESKAAA
ncbi:MAG: hypothetical protein KJ936_01925 [Proteobacteria bacterium]|nr:hypothetical protein [Pseudomonadota bacterium]MBU2226425.1 hypothetical protein [Pseudomonadota bacterium]MBU2262162.1 hypothetical protein [Pseudomonadota bacterium]